MHELKQNIRPLSLMLSIPLLTIIYRELNRPNDKVYSLSTSFDRAVPFLKVFVLPYYGFYLFVFFVMMYLCIKNRKTYYHTLLAINLSYIVSFIIYGLFQTTVPRPLITEHDVLSGLISTMYQMDHPYNAFPSLHVVTSYIMIKAVQESSLKNFFVRSYLYIIGILVIISTQFIKQHVAFDLIAGLLVGELSYEIVSYVTCNEVIMSKLSFIKQYHFYSEL